MGGSQQINFSEMPVGRAVNTLRIIISAMAMGLLAFGVVVNTAIEPPERPEDGVLTQIGLGLGLLALVVHRLIGSVVESSSKKNLPADEDAARGQLVGAKLTGTIVAIAILEAAAFLNLIAYGFIDGQPISMAMATLLWFAIVIKFPMGDAVKGWLDAELRAAREQRELRGEG